MFIVNIICMTIVDQSNTSMVWR